MHFNYYLFLINKIEKKKKYIYIYILIINIVFKEKKEIKQHQIISYIYI